MLTAFKSSFFWQMAGGFLLGALGLVAVQPGEVGHALASRIGIHDTAAR